MSAATVLATGSTARRSGARISRSAVVRLAVRDARRIVTHPVYVLILLYATFAIGLDFVTGLAELPSRKNVAEATWIIFGFLLPMVTLFPANLVASSARRAGSESMFDATALGRSGRVAASCLAAVLMSGIGLAAGLAVWRISHVEPALESTINFAQAVSFGLIWFGVSALGVAIAQWLPWPGVTVPVLVGLVIWTGTAGGSDNWYAATMPWTFSSDVNAWDNVEVSQLWHCVYLGGLGALAVTAALYRDRLARMVAVGAGVGAVTVLAAWLQVR